MKLDLGPSRSTYVTPTFAGDDRASMDGAMRQRMRRPMMIGAAVIAVFVLGLGLWASVTSIENGVNGIGEVRVEANRKTLRHLQPGTIRQILVKEGERVKAQQPLILFDDVEARAAFDVYQNQYDSLLAQSARFTAEATNRPQLDFPAELTARIADPRVAGLIRDQQFLFTTRQQLYQSQVSVLSQRLDQIQAQIQGQQAQVDSTDEQSRLTGEMLEGYKKLAEQGFASKNLVRNYEARMSEFAGRKGQLAADIARLKQQIGETRMQMAATRDQRESQAAEGLRDSQSRLADIGPRFTAAKQTLAETVVRSPVDGYVFNLTQFTIGGVTGGGELLMDVVPANAPMMVTAAISPQEIDDVHVGQDARVRLVGLNQRFNSPLPGKVAVVSADRTVNDKTGAASFRVDVRIDPKDIAKLQHGVKLTSGMPAQVLIVSGKRTIMGFLISPITETWQDAFREH